MNPSEVVSKIKDITKINPFVDSRKRSVVEIRALLCFLLREKLNMRWIAIKELFLKNGRRTDNSTLMNAINSYKKFALSNKELKEIENQFVFNSEPVDQISKVQILENRLRILSRKLRNCEKENKQNTKDIILRES